MKISHVTRRLSRRVRLAVVKVRQTANAAVHEKIGKDLYRQVYRVRFPEKTGKTIEVVTVSDASHQECSMSGVDVYVVERQLGGK